MASPRDRLIFALDVPTAAEATAWVERLGDSVAFYKIGMELLTSGDYFRVLEDLAQRGKQVFGKTEIGKQRGGVVGAHGALGRDRRRKKGSHCTPRHSNKCPISICPGQTYGKTRRGMRTIPDHGQAAVVFIDFGPEPAFRSGPYCLWPVRMRGC